MLQFARVLRPILHKLNIKRSKYSAYFANKGGTFGWQGEAPRVTSSRLHPLSIFGRDSLGLSFRGVTMGRRPTRARENPLAMFT